MLDILFIIAALIGIAALGVLILAAMKPTTFRIERSIAINAPAERVFAWISDLKAMNSWNPFAKADPAIQITYSGPEGGTGAAYDWDSTGRAGKGHMQVTAFTPGRSVDLDLVMEKPFPANNQVRFSLEPAGDAIRVTWAMWGPWPYLHRIMGTIVNTDKMVGGEFEKGLRDLKASAERA